MIWRKDEQAESAPGAPLSGAEREQLKGERGREGRRMAGDEREVTIVGQAATLEGTVLSAGSLRIDGKVKGQIQADGDVILSPQSQVEADINAENCTVAGQFKGNVIVKGTAELTRGGRIDGNITCKTLIVQEGGIFQGQSIMDQQAQATAAQTQAAKSSAAAPTSGQAVQSGSKEEDKAKVSP